MPEWSAISGTLHFWQEMLTRAFWDSLLFFYETRAGALKAIFITLIGMGLTTLIVRLVRDRAAFREHILSNVLLVIAGGVASWVFVLACFIVSEPFLQRRQVLTELRDAKEQASSAVIAREGAEIRQRIGAFQQLRGLCLVGRSKQPVSIGQPCAAQRQFPAEMFIARNDPQVRNLSLAVVAFMNLLPEYSLGATSPGCRLRVTAPKENGQTAALFYDVASWTRCNVDVRVADDLHPEVEAEALGGAEDNIVIVHAPKSDQRYDMFARRLSALFHVKRRYDAFHEGQPDQAIWLQIGRGFPWQVENTLKVFIGGR